jgi:hypothetical protein
MKTADVARGREGCAICTIGFFTTAPIEFPPIGVNYRVRISEKLDREIGNQESATLRSFTNDNAAASDDDFSCLPCGTVGSCARD